MMDELKQLKDELQEHVQTQDLLLESKLKMWIMSAVVLQVVPLITIAFFIGGIYQSLSSSMSMVQQQQNDIRASRDWMQERAQWELSVEIWGAQQNPPLRVPRATMSDRQSDTPGEKSQ